MKRIDISGDARINWSAGIYDSDRTRLTIEGRKQVFIVAKSSMKEAK